MYQSTPLYSTERCPDCEVHSGEPHIAGCSVGEGIFTLARPEFINAPRIAPFRIEKTNTPTSNAQYESLREVLDAAYAQSAYGKGRERHANDRPFDKQPVLEMARMVGVGGPVFQAMKKAQEAVGMANRGEIDKAIHELLGTIVYAAAAVVLLKEQK